MASLCGCFGVKRTPSIKHSTGEYGMPGKLEPDLPMPPEAELNQKFAELVDQLDLDRLHRDVMFNLTPEKKWQLYCSKRKEQDDMLEGPEPYIEQLNHLTQHNTLLLTSPNVDNSEESKLRMVDSLRTALRTQPISFVVGFIENKGLESILAFLAKMDDATLQSGLHTSVLGCVKALMNNSQGRSHVLAHRDAINIISQSLASDNLKTKTSCIEILGAMCLVPGGHKKVLGAMLHFQKYASERTRFQTIINDLDRSTGIYRDEIGIKSTIMSFINVILKYGSGQDSLDFRMHLRYEFLMLGLQPIVDKLRRHGNATLNKHIEFFELVRNSDEKDFSKRFELLHVDTRSATNMFELLRKRLYLSTSYAHLLSVLKHLLLLPNQSKGSQYWSLIDRLIQQVCLQQPDGTNPDVEVAHIDVNKAVRLAQENEVKSVQTQMRQLQKENDELVRQLQKRERECEVKSQEKDELMSTVNEMKEKLEKETIEAANLAQQINTLKGQLIVEQQERQTLQQYVKTGNLPDDTKVGAILSPASLPPVPPTGGPPPPPAPGGPPPPPLPGGPSGPPAPLGMGSPAPAPKQKKVPKPSIALKSFNWSKIPTDKTAHTVFEGLEDERLYKQLDLQDFECQFSAYQPKEGGEKIVKHEPKELSLIDGRRAQNCTILLSKIKLSSEELRKSILSVDRGEELAKDMVEQLLKFVPTAEESQMLTEHEKERDQMARADRFLLDICKVPHYEQRLKALYYKKKFNDRMAEAKPKIVDILEASKQLSNSRKVKRLLEVVLAFGNYMNKGNRGNAFGFRMSSLNKVADTKSSQNRDYNFLNYLVEVFHRQFPQLLEMESEIHKVKEAKKVALPELQKEVNMLGMELKEIRKEILYQKNHKTGDPDDRFVQVMSDFVTVAEYKYSELESKYKEAMEKYSKVVTLYCEDKDKTAPDEFFGIFSDFLEAVDLAQAQNKRRQLRAEEEKRRVAIDAKMKAERTERKNAERQSKSVRRDAGETVAVPTGKGEFDDLISALRTGNVYDDDILKMNKKGGVAGRKRQNKPPVKVEGQSSSAGGYKSKYAQPII